MPTRRLQIPPSVLETLLAQARDELPNECCGFLAGVWESGIGFVRTAIPLVNRLASPVAYDAELKSLLAAHRRMRELGLVELAIYHSHPTSAPVPSRTDLARNAYGDQLVHLILGLAEAEPQVRGWWLSESTFTEAEVTIR
jgi:proteasome lid subunit RPN8/RPN11